MPTDSTMRIAILDCDPLTTSIRAKYGNYGGVVTAFLHAGARRLGLEPGQLEISSWDVMKESSKYPALDSIDAVVITGSSKGY